MQLVLNQFKKNLPNQLGIEYGFSLAKIISKCCEVMSYLAWMFVYSVTTLQKD